MTGKHCQHQSNLFPQPETYVRKRQGITILSWLSLKFVWPIISSV